MHEPFSFNQVADSGALPGFLAFLVGSLGRSALSASYTHVSKQPMWHQPCLIDSRQPLSLGPAMNDSDYAVKGTASRSTAASAHLSDRSARPRDQVAAATSLPLKLPDTHEPSVQTLCNPVTTVSVQHLLDGFGLCVLIKIVLRYLTGGRRMRAIRKSNSSRKLTSNKMRRKRVLL